MPDRLGPTQTRVLEAFTTLDSEADPPTAREINGHVRRGDIYAALYRLEEHGYVRRAGETFSGAVTWQLTSAGRDALNLEGDTA